MDKATLSDGIKKLYHDFTNAGLEHHYTSYFPQLKVYFKHGSLSIRIHALELILNIVLGGKWAQDVVTPSPSSAIKSLPSNVGIVQFRIEQINKRLHGELTDITQEIDNVGKDPEPPYPNELTEAEALTAQVAIDTIIDWLFEVLPPLEEEKLLTVFFIFFTTHWEHIQATDAEKFQRLYQLHNRLMKNKKYAKIKAFERLNLDYYSSGYHPIY